MKYIMFFPILIFGVILVALAWLLGFLWHFSHNKAMKFRTWVEEWYIDWFRSMYDKQFFRIEENEHEK